MRFNRIVKGKVLRLSADKVWIEFGSIYQGAVPLQEWFDEVEFRVVPPRPGDVVDVLLESVEPQTHRLRLSYRKARRLYAPGEEAFEKALLQRLQVGDVVPGIVTRQIDDGLVVNIGVNTFLPAWEVEDIPPQYLDQYVGRSIDCEIVEIDEDRHHIVVKPHRPIKGLPG
jgi:small subunit ribosomal protein S1